jgi:hypothetical protein
MYTYKQFDRFYIVYNIHYMDNTNAVRVLAGSWIDHRESLVVALAMLLVTVLYETASLYIVPEYSLNIGQVLRAFGSHVLAISCAGRGVS